MTSQRVPFHVTLELELDSGWQHETLEFDTSAKSPAQAQLFACNYFRRHGPLGLCDVHVTSCKVYDWPTWLVKRGY